MFDTSCSFYEECWKRAKRVYDADVIRIRKEKGEGSVGQVYRNQERPNFNETFGHRLQENPEEAQVPKRPMVSLLCSIHQLLLQGGTKKSVRQQRGEEVQVWGLHQKEEVTRVCLDTQRWQDDWNTVGNRWQNDGRHGG